MGRVRATFGGLLFLFYFNFLSIFGGVFNNHEMIIANSALPAHARGIILKHMENHKLLKSGIYLFHILIVIKFLIISQDFSVNTKKKGRWVTAELLALD